MWSYGEFKVGGRVEVLGSSEGKRLQAVPKILCAHMGFNSAQIIGSELRIGSQLKWLEALDHVEILACESEKQRIVFCQSNYSRFYEKHYQARPEPGHVWHDYFYAVTTAALDAAYQLWKTDVVELEHLVGYCDYPVDMVTTWLEVFMNLQDARIASPTHIIIDHGTEEFLHVLPRAQNKLEQSERRPHRATLGDCREWNLSGLDPNRRPVEGVRLISFDVAVDLRLGAV